MYIKHINHIHPPSSPPLSSPFPPPEPILWTCPSFSTPKTVFKGVSWCISAVFWSVYPLLLLSITLSLPLPTPIIQQHRYNAFQYCWFYHSAFLSLLSAALIPNVFWDKVSTYFACWSFANGCDLIALTYLKIWIYRVKRVPFIPNKGISLFILSFFFFWCGFFFFGYLLLGGFQL
jgi:hypothetical protein